MLVQIEGCRSPWPELCQPIRDNQTKGHRKPEQQVLRWMVSLNSSARLARELLLI